METISPNNTRRWMLVDDNKELLTMLAELVKHFTDAVIETHSSPLTALGAFGAAPEKYELVITDYEMPGMDGVELCHKLHAISSMQKVFLATGSGYFSESTARHLGFSALLHKPFPLTALSEALATVGLANETAAIA